MSEENATSSELESRGDSLRSQIQTVALEVERTLKYVSGLNGDNNLSDGNIPRFRNANMIANLTLAFRHLEDARMRIGKVMQAYQGGVSILDADKDICK